MSEPEELDASLMASLVIAEIAAWNAVERALSASRVPLSYGRYLVLLTITGALGRLTRRTESGYVRSYAGYMLAGTVLVLIAVLAARF